jgi:hypothetical protein
MFGLLPCVFFVWTYMLINIVYVHACCVGGAVGPIELRYHSVFHPRHQQRRDQEEDQSRRL